MALLRMKIDGEKYSVDPDKLTLGEACLLEEEYGVTSLADLDFFKPRHLKGLFFTAVRRKHPDLSTDEVMAKVTDGITGEVFQDLNKQVEEAIKAEADPPLAGGGKPEPAGASGSAATRKTSGPRR